LSVQSPAAHAGNFLTQDCKKINKALSVGVILICSDHKLLWQDSFKVVDGASMLPESTILHRIIILPASEATGKFRKIIKLG